MSIDTKHTRWIQDILNEHQGILLGYVYGLVHNHDISQDVVQEAFIRLCQQNQEDIEGHERPWLFKVCRNKAIDILRKEKPMQALEDDMLPHQADTRTPAYAAEEQEQQSLLLAHVAQLPAAQEEVIRLKFHGGLSYKEIAEVTNRKVGTIGMLLHTALKQLRNTTKLQEALA